MSMRVQVAGLALIAAALLATPAVAAKDAAAGDVVVATVNGEKIYKKDVMEAIKSIPRLQGADAATQASVFPNVLEQVVTERLVVEATKKSKIEADPEYQKRLEAAKDMIGNQLFVERILKDKVTDAAVKNAYEEYKKENAGKEELKARQILVATEEEAKQVIKDLDAGQKFEELAKKRSTGPSAQNGGEIPGYFVKEEMLPEISGVAFGLSPGGYTKTPIKSQFGWHIIKVEDKRKRVVSELKDVEGALRNKLTQEAVNTLTRDLRSKAKVELFDMNGKPLEAPKAK
jgi:peptidyl-prolyl cis-trans isomerase C